MSSQTAEQLASKKCQGCEGDAPKYTRAEAQQQVAALSGWKLAADADKIRKEWNVENFMAGIEFFNAVAKIAEEQDHHPDLHLTGYRKVEIELSTHSVGGLSENDFVLAAKIDRLPVRLKKSS